VLARRRDVSRCDGSGDDTGCRQRSHRIRSGCVLAPLFYVGIAFVVCVAGIIVIRVYPVD